MIITKRQLKKLIKESVESKKLLDFCKTIPASKWVFENDWAQSGNMEIDDDGTPDSNKVAIYGAEVPEMFQEQFGDYIMIGIAKSEGKFRLQVESDYNIEPYSEEFNSLSQAASRFQQYFKFKPKFITV